MWSVERVSLVGLSVEPSLEMKLASSLHWVNFLSLCYFLAFIQAFFIFRLSFIHQHFPERHLISCKRHHVRQKLSSTVSMMDKLNSPEKKKINSGRWCQQSLSFLLLVDSPVCFFAWSEIWDFLSLSQAI